MTDTEPDTEFDTDSLTEDQVSMLMHMLGLSEQHFSDPDCYRNHAAVEAGTETHEMFQSMEEQGIVKHTGSPDKVYDYHFYSATKESKTLALKLYQKNLGTRAERRYKRFLSLQDVHPELTFRAFLMDDYWREARNDL